MKKFVALVAVAALVAFAAPAFAANPFMDVPMEHWAYDAVSQLASRGIVTGYPDGAFKGEWKATRYEMASVVARALAHVDMNKASKEDLELLKRLVVEFKDELDALGVKVEDLDERVGVLEDRLGGWEFSGYFRTTAKMYDNKDDDWSADRFRLNMRKYLDDKVTMNIRLQGGAGESLAVELAYLSIKDFLFEGSSLTVGKFWHDWEGGFYAVDPFFFNINDAWITDRADDLGFAYSVPFAGLGSFNLYVARDSVDQSIEEDEFDVIDEYSYGEIDVVIEDDLYAKASLDTGRYVYGARLDFQFNEMFGMGLNWMNFDYDSGAEGQLFIEETETVIDGDFETSQTWLWKGPKVTLAADYNVLWADFTVDFTPGIEFKGQYFKEDLDPAWQVTGDTPDDSPTAWKAVLDVDQDVLGFTSLWVEYAQLDKGFVMDNTWSYGWVSGVHYLNSMGQVAEDTDIWNVYAQQKWNEKWGTYLRYNKVDGGQFADYDVWTASIQYWYTPNMAFEVGYDKLDGTSNYGDAIDEDTIWVRTAVFF
ncbi:MAG: S-layer homology domain-containing protein [Thermovirgaceae bacterium]